MYVFFGSHPCVPILYIGVNFKMFNVFSRFFIIFFRFIRSSTINTYLCFLFILFRLYNEPWVGPENSPNLASASQSALWPTWANIAVRNLKAFQKLIRWRYFSNHIHNYPWINNDSDYNYINLVKIRTYFRDLEVACCVSLHFFTIQ